MHLKGGKQKMRVVISKVASLFLCIPKSKKVAREVCPLLEKTHERQGCRTCGVQAPGCLLNKQFAITSRGTTRELRRFEPRDER